VAPLNCTKAKRKWRWWKLSDEILHRHGSSRQGTFPMRVSSYFARNFRALIKAGHGPSYGQRGYGPVFQRRNAALVGKAARERQDDKAPSCSATCWLVVVACVAGLARGTRCGAAVAGTGPAMQAGGWEAFQARPGGSTPLGPFAPRGLSRCRCGDQLLSS